MSLTILSVAYPLAPVSPDAAGGAEQILASLDEGIVAAGHRSIVVAQAGSRTAGALLPIPVPLGALDEGAKRAAHVRVRAAVAEARRDATIDVVHMHGIDFAEYLPPPGVPVLATLHLPPDWYADGALHSGRPETWLHCVSANQHRACPEVPGLLAPIENGIDVDRLAARHALRRFVLFLGRICPEKGVHHAIDAAESAGVPLLVAGEVFAYPEHRAYFEEAICPRLGAGCRYLGPVGFARKRRLLTAARAVLIPSTAPETSSLVAREAAACGAPVVAFRNGALTEAVRDGETGFLVSDAAGMAAAIARCDTLSRDHCRAIARSRFSRSTMIAAYLDLYARLAAPDRARRSAAS